MASHHFDVPQRPLAGHLINDNILCSYHLSKAGSFRCSTVSHGWNVLRFSTITRIGYKERYALPHHTLSGSFNQTPKLNFLHRPTTTLIASQSTPFFVYISTESALARMTLPYKAIIDDVSLYNHISLSSLPSSTCNGFLVQHKDRDRITVRSLAINHCLLLADTCRRKARTRYAFNAVLLTVVTVISKH